MAILASTVNRTKLGVESGGGRPEMARIGEIGGRGALGSITINGELWKI